MRKILVVLAGIFINMITYGALIAAEAAEKAVEAGKTDPLAYIGLALAIGLPALGTAWAQARIGSAGAGTLAERPEMAVWVLILLAIPETIVILGFVVAFMLLLKI
jgi:V/A-type H+-transporting ATPase subunit K